VSGTPTASRYSLRGTPRATAGASGTRMASRLSRNNYPSYDREVIGGPTAPRCRRAPPWDRWRLAGFQTIGPKARPSWERATGNKADLGSQMRSGLRPVLLNAGETPAVPGGRCSALVPELGQLFCAEQGHWDTIWRIGSSALAERLGTRALQEALRDAIVGS
jgi:hypothetical protein